MQPLQPLPPPLPSSLRVGANERHPNHTLRGVQLASERRKKQQHQPNDESGGRKLAITDRPDYVRPTEWRPRRRSPEPITTRCSRTTCSRIVVGKQTNKQTNQHEHDVNLTFCASSLSLTVKFFSPPREARNLFVLSRARAHTDCRSTSAACLIFFFGFN